jgi:hypothetical protein
MVAKKVDNLFFYTSILTIIKMTTLIKNPLLCNNPSISAIDERTNEEITVSRLNIGKYFKQVYCICPFTSIVSSIYNDTMIDQSTYYNTIDKMILYKANISILKNLIHYGNLIHCKKEYIERANKFEYMLEEMVLIIPFFNISFLNLKKYIDKINSDNNLDSLYNTMIISNYFGENQMKLSNKLYTLHMIKSFVSSDYWKQEYNCKYNLTKLFEQRNFNFSILKPSSSSSINKIINSLDTVHLKGNYLEEIFKTKKYMDPASILCRKGYKLYNVVKGCTYTTDTIYNMFSSIEDSTIRFILYCQLAVSREYCHLVINNSKVAIMMNSTITKYLDIFQYIYGYAWLRFYFEECICKYNMKTTDMYIFDIETASNLPVFHFDYDEPHENPYMPILVGKHALNPSNNVGGIVITDTSHRICNLNEFIERLNIFTCNKRDKYLFQGIDFSDYKMAITGSVMTACLQYCHPLLKLFETTQMTMDDLYNRFFNEYYCDADIDIMILTSDTIEFLDIGKRLRDRIAQNICSMYDYAEMSHVGLRVMKQVYLFVTKEFIKDNILTLNSELTEEIILTNLSSPAIIKLFLPYAEKLHADQITKSTASFDDMKKTQLYIDHPEYHDFDQSMLVIKLYNKTVNSTLHKARSPTEYTEEDIEKILESTETDHFNPMIFDTSNISISMNFKLRIFAPQLDHELEIFPIKKDDFMATVGNFHMPCVRAYYNGTNVYMTPSCITAHLTYMNIDYKYFAGSKDPIEIINKYRMRGFGTWLNKKEIATYLKYSSLVPFWNNLYCINLTNKATLKNCLGPLPINHILYQPRQFNIDLYSNPNIKPIPFEDPYVNQVLKQELTRQQYMTLRYKSLDLSNEVKDIMRAVICKDTGYVNPLHINIIDHISSIYDKTNKIEDVEPQTGYVEPQIEDID